MDEPLHRYDPSLWNVRRRSEEEWSQLPALVQKGADRSEVLRNVSMSFLTDCPIDSPFSWVQDHVRAGGGVLRDVALIDENELEV